MPLISIEMSSPSVLAYAPSEEHIYLFLTPPTLKGNIPLSQYLQIRSLKIPPLSFQLEAGKRMVQMLVPNPSIPL